MRKIWQANRKHFVDGLKDLWKAIPLLLARVPVFGDIRALVTSKAFVSETAAGMVVNPLRRLSGVILERGSHVRNLQQQ